MKFSFTKLLIIIGALVSLSFAGCSNGGSSDIKRNNIESIALIGEPEKRKYTNTEQKWDFSGLNVLVSYEDKTSITIPLTDSNVEYDVWPLAPYTVTKEEVNLEFKRIAYTTSDGKTIENETSVMYKMTFELKSSDYIRTSTFINMAVIIFVFMTVLTSVVLFTVDGKRKE